MSKLRTSIDAFLKSDGMHAKLDHLTAMEINSVRPLLPHALDQMMRIQTVSIISQKNNFITRFILLLIMNKLFSQIGKSTQLQQHLNKV